MTKRRTIEGFTLVEMIVSLGIFAIVAVVAVTALLKIVDANKKAQTIESAITNLNFALDTMSRELRVGSSMQCLQGNNGTYSTGSISFGTQSCSVITEVPVLLVFKSSNVDTTSNPSCQLVYAYLFTKSDINYPGQLMLEKAEQPAGTCAAGYTFTPPSLAGSSYTPIVSDNVALLSFYLNVSYNQTTQPFPLVFVSISGSAGTVETTKTYFQTQTAASPRVP